jgi:hypothetical protein
VAISDQAPATAIDALFSAVDARLRARHALAPGELPPLFLSPRLAPSAELFSKACFLPVDDANAEVPTTSVVVDTDPLWATDTAVLVVVSPFSVEEVEQKARRLGGNKLRETGPARVVCLRAASPEHGPAALDASRPPRSERVLPSQPTSSFRVTHIALESAPPSSIGVENGAVAPFGLARRYAAIAVLAHLLGARDERPTTSTTTASLDPTRSTTWLVQKSYPGAPIAEGPPWAAAQESLTSDPGRWQAHRAWARASTIRSLLAPEALADHLGRWFLATGDEGAASAALDQMAVVTIADVTAVLEEARAAPIYVEDRLPGAL